MVIQHEPAVEWNDRSDEAPDVSHVRHNQNAECGGALSPAADFVAFFLQTLRHGIGIRRIRHQRLEGASCQPNDQPKPRTGNRPNRHAGQAGPGAGRSSDGSAERHAKHRAGRGIFCLIRTSPQPAEFRPSPAQIHFQFSLLFPMEQQLFIGAQQWLRHRTRRQQ